VSSDPHYHAFFGEGAPETKGFLHILGLVIDTVSVCVCVCVLRRICMLVRSPFLHMYFSVCCVCVCVFVCARLITSSMLTTWLKFHARAYCYCR
jgi:hypothetical protein